MRQTTRTKLEYLAETKSLIKSALIEKGQEVADGDDFRSYVDKIRAISGGGASGGNGWETVPVIPAKLSALPPKAFVFNNKIHVAFQNADTSGNEIWRLDDDGWHYFTSTTYSNGSNTHFVELNGELHRLSGTSHSKYDFDSGEWVKFTTTLKTSSSYGELVFVYNGELYAIAGDKCDDLYKFDGTVWNLIHENVITQPTIGSGCCVSGNKLYYVRYLKLYSFDPITGTETLVGDVTGAQGKICAIGDAFYFLPTSTYGIPICKYADGQLVELGTYTLTSIAGGAYCVLNNKFYLFGAGSSWLGYRVGCSWTPPQ